MRNNTVIPIIKYAHLDLTVLDNYRVITLSNLISKLIDHLILNRYSNVFITSNLQFAFKPGSSCNQCNFCVTETVKDFVTNESHPVAYFLDLKKAFDRVNLSLLFKKICDRGAPANLTRVLLGLYTQQQLCVCFGMVSRRTHFMSTMGQARLRFVANPFFAYILMTFCSS